MKHSGITLGKIVRSFKAHSCCMARESGVKSFAWQRNYHDHIIRSDLERFYIERYIELNPLLWCIDPDNPVPHNTPIAEADRIVEQNLGLDEDATRYLLDRVSEYLSWRETFNADEN